MRAYSQDLRDRVLRALDRNEHPKIIAERLEVSRMWVYRVRRRWQTQGARTSLPRGGHRRSRIAHLQPAIRSWIEDQPSVTLSELCQRVACQGISIKAPALWHQLDKWGLSFKKNAARQHAKATGAPLNMEYAQPGLAG